MHHNPRSIFFLLSGFRFINVSQLAPLLQFLRDRWANYASVSKTLRVHVKEYWLPPQHVGAAAAQHNEVSEFNISRLTAFLFSFLRARRSRAAI